MTYKQLKWFILLIPTVTVGIWEYVRHEYLLSYISMDLGNWLTPLIVLFVTFTLLTRFFSKLEKFQEQLKVERAEKAVLEERERIARDLHDGVAQSLFLLSIKIKQLDQLRVIKEDEEKLVELNKSINDVHDYVRSGIENLRLPVEEEYESWLTSINNHIEEFEIETGMNVIKEISVNSALLNGNERFELTACIGETLINIRKHAQAKNVWLKLVINNQTKYMEIIDDGIGISKSDLQPGHYGIKMMEERCLRIGWKMRLLRKLNRTIVTFKPS